MSISAGRIFSKIVTLYYQNQGYTGFPQQTETAFVANSVKKSLILQTLEL